MTVEQQWRTCSECGHNKPLDEFHQDPHGPDGRRMDCADCRAKKREMDALRQRSELLGKIIDKIQGDGHEQLVRFLGHRDASPSVPTSDDVIELFMRGVGGLDGMIRLMLADYYAAKVGSRERVKIMQSMVQMIKENSRDKKGKKLDQLSESELNALLLAKIEELGAAQVEKKIVNGAVVTHQSPVEVDAVEVDPVPHEGPEDSEPQ